MSATPVQIGFSALADFSVLFAFQNVDGTPQDVTVAGWGTLALALTAPGSPPILFPSGGLTLALYPGRTDAMLAYGQFATIAPVWTPLLAYTGELVLSSPGTPPALISLATIAATRGAASQSASTAGGYTVNVQRGSVNTVVSRGPVLRPSGPSSFVNSLIFG